MGGVRGGLGVEGDGVGSRPHELPGLALGALDHEMRLQHSARVVHALGERGDDQRAERDRGDEVPVHDVDVDHAGARVEHLPDLLAQAAEVGGQDRGSDAHVAHQRRRRRGHTACSIESPQLLHFMIAVEDIRTIVECSPQFGHTELSSKRCRQYTQR